MSSHRLVLLPNWVEEDLPDQLGIRYTINHLIKMIENSIDLLPRMIEHPTNDIEKIEDLLIMRVTLESKPKLRSVIEDQWFLNMFEMITESLDPDLWNLQKVYMKFWSTRWSRPLMRRIVSL
jgi:hypothetical protein